MITGEKNIKVLALTLYGMKAASTRYRIAQYKDLFSAESIDLDISCLLNDEYLIRSFSGRRTSLIELSSMYASRIMRLTKRKKYDCAIVHLELFPMIPGWIEKLCINIPYIYDFDDAFYLRYHSKGGLAKCLLGRKFAPMLERAKAIVAGNENLGGYARRFNRNVVVLPTVLDPSLYASTGLQDRSTFTVGWIGSPSTAKYLALIAEPLAVFAREVPVRFVAIGGYCPAIELSRFDVGVMPLHDDEWARGKCGFKLLQYMACGIPSIASPVGVNVDILSDGCGLLAADGAAWLDAFRTYHGDPRLRSIAGLAGRSRVEQRYSVHRTAPLYIDLIRSILD